MMTFVHDSPIGRVVFGVGRRTSLGEEIERLGLARLLILCSPSQRARAEETAHALGSAAIGVFGEPVSHLSPALAARASAEAVHAEADGLVAIGGGSSVGLAKAVARERGLPIASLPTTYAGSEMTPVWGLTEAGVKRTGRDPRVLPKLVIYDPELSLDLPPGIAAASGMNALAHCVEALYAPGTSPIVCLMAEEGIGSLARSLPGLVAAPRDIDARSQALYGAWLSGAALGGVAMALHHKLCHVLGGRFGLPHAQTHAAVLPHVAAYNRSVAPDAMDRIARALGCKDAPGGLFELASAIGCQMALGEFGLRESDLDEAADLATRDPYPNPRPLERAGVRALLADALNGRRPQTA